MKDTISFSFVTKNMKNFLARYQKINAQKIALEVGKKWQEAARAKAPVKSGRLKRGILAKSFGDKTATGNFRINVQLYFSSKGNPSPKMYGKYREKGGIIPSRNNPRTKPFLIPVNKLEGKNITARSFISSPRYGFIKSFYYPGVGIFGVTRKKTKGIDSENTADLVFLERKRTKHVGTNFISSTRNVAKEELIKLFREMIFKDE